jgi:hypothetical protein
MARNPETVTTSRLAPGTAIIRIVSSPTLR